MHIKTFTKATPQQIKSLKGRKLDDFSTFRKKKLKQQQNPTSEYPEQLIITSKSQKQSSDLLNSMKVNFKHSKAREIKAKNKQAVKQNIKNKIFQQLKNLIEKNAFKYTKTSTFTQLHQDVTVRGKTAHQNQRLPYPRYYTPPKTANYDDQPEIKRNKSFGERPLKMKKTLTKTEGRRSSQSDICQNLRYFQNKEFSYDRPKHNRASFDNLIRKEELQIRPWAIKNWDDDESHFH